MKKGRKLKWIILVIVVLAVISAALGSTGDKKTDTASGDHLQETNSQTTESEQKAIVLEDEKDKTDMPEDTTAPKTDEPSDESTADTDSSLSLGQKNALAKAGVYLSIGGFSHDGLITQLEFEGFTNEEAVYAADHCGADWNEEAAKKAQQYMNISAFSKSGLIDQLKFEGFTDEQAEYGAAAVGY